MYVHVSSDDFFLRRRVYPDISITASHIEE